MRVVYAGDWRQLDSGMWCLDLVCSACGDASPITCGHRAHAGRPILRREFEMQAQRIAGDAARLEPLEAPAAF